MRTYEPRAHARQTEEPPPLSRCSANRAVISNHIKVGVWGKRGGGSEKESARRKLHAQSDGPCESDSLMGHPDRPTHRPTDHNQPTDILWFIAPRTAQLRAQPAAARRD